MRNIHALNNRNIQTKSQPKGRNQRNIQILVKLFYASIRKLHRNLTELKRTFNLAKKSSTTCDEHKDCKVCWQKYHKEELISHIYIGVKEQWVRDLIDQVPDDKPKLDKYVEIGENYDMS